MHQLFALMHLAQVDPTGTLITEGAKGFNEGGFKAVAVTLAAAWILTAIAAWRIIAQKDKVIAEERAASRELVQSLKTDSIGATQTYGKIETTLALTNQALSTLGNEVRVLGDIVRRGAA